MTENKRFEVVMNEFDEVEYIMDKTMMEDRDFAEFLDFVEDVCKENEQLKEENNKLHQKIFEMRTNIALERTEISKQTYTGKKNEREYLDVKEFLDEIEKW